MKPNYEFIKLAADVLWNSLEESNPKSKDALSKAINKAKREYLEKRCLGSISGYAQNYFTEAKRAILERNFVYDEALGIVNIEYGYNPNTGKWDGSYEGCKLRGSKVLERSKGLVIIK